MSNAPTKPVRRVRPPPREPAPTNPVEFLEDIHRRIVRIETRLGRLMEHHNLTSRGDPKN